MGDEARRKVNTDYLDFTAANGKIDSIRALRLIY
jgi:hypothetical protein